MKDYKGKNILFRGPSWNMYEDNIWGQFRFQVNFAKAAFY